MISKDLIIHIGTQKTGSSALQTSLSCNQKLLSENDIYFLEYSWQRGAYVLHEIDWRDQSLLEQERKKLEEMIENAKESTVLLSCSEYVGDLDVCYANAREMASKLDAVTKKYPRKIIVYIRRQDEFIESSYAQYVKQGASYSFAEFRQQYDIYQFDWFKLLGIYREIFGSQNLVIRPYEKLQLFEGDVTRDFYNTIGVHSLTQLQKHSYSNHGYNPAGLEIARIYNKIYAHNTEKKVHLKNLLQNRMPKQKYDNLYFFNYAERKEILAFYEESNRNVAREYLQKDCEQLFEENPDDYASKKVRKNRLVLADVMGYIMAFFLRPLISKTRRVLRI